MNNDEQKDYPGYPHYPSGEDITRAGNNNGRQPIEPTGEKAYLEPDSNSSENTADSDTDVRPDELGALESIDQMDGPETLRVKNSELDNTDEDGYPLNESSGVFTDNTRDGLDVPGSLDDDAAEDLGEEDEENNYYSEGEDQEDMDQDNRE